MEFEWNIFPGFNTLQLSQEVKELLLRFERNTREIYWTGHPHVDFQRHIMGIKGQRERLQVKCSTRFSLCKEIRSRTMVIPRAWIREKVVFHQ